LDDAQEILNEWNSSSFAISSQSLLISMDNVRWEYVDEPLPKANRYFPVDVSEDSEWFTVAYYTKTRRRVQIWRDGFSQLNGISQVALFVHEALRDIQIGWAKNNDGFNEEALQEATAIYVLCKASYTLSQYINFILANKKEAAIQSFGPTPVVIKKFCRSRYE
jgi:hypothetical protein